MATPRPPELPSTCIVLSVLWLWFVFLSPGARTCMMVTIMTKHTARNEREKKTVHKKLEQPCSLIVWMIKEVLSIFERDIVINCNILDMVQPAKRHDNVSGNQTSRYKSLSSLDPREKRSSIGVCITSTRSYFNIYISFF